MKISESGPSAGGGGGKVGPSDVVFVDPAGSDATGARGNAAKPFLTVRAAVAAMTTPGDAVVVAPGVFNETAGGGTITEPVGVTRWSLIGYGQSAADGAGTPTGTIVEHTTADLFTLRNTCTGFSFSGITLVASGAARRAIVADGTGGGGATMTAGLVGSNATILAQAGFLFRDLGVVDISHVDVGGQTAAAVVDTCSSVRLSDTELVTDLNLSWNDADASKPAAGRVLMLLQSLRVPGNLTLDRQVKLVGDGGCKIGNLLGGANLVVSGGLALSQVWTGSKFGTFGGADGIIDFTTGPLPDTAINVVCGFWTCSLYGHGTITFDVGGASIHRQRVNFDNATFDADPGGPKVLHVGRAIDADCTNTSFGPGVTLTVDATATIGQRIGILTAEVDYFGGQRVGETKITTATGAYTVLFGDYCLLVDTATGAIADITLFSDGGAPTGVGRVQVFQDIGGQAPTNPFRVLAPGGGSINGAASVTVSQAYGGIVLITFDGSNYFTPACCGSISGAFFLVGDISPPQLTASVNNYAPTALNTAVGLRLSSNALWNLTGLTGGSAGRIMFVENVGTNPIVLTTEDAASTAANRFSFDANVTLMPGQTMLLRYDGTSSRWRGLPPEGTVTGPVALTSQLTPAQITADTNDYAPTGFATASSLRLDTNAIWSLTGIAGGAAGRMIYVYYIGTTSLVLTDEDAASAAANRFGFDAPVILIAGTGVMLQYDATSTRWRKAEP